MAANEIWSGETRVEVTLDNTYVGDMIMPSTMKNFYNYDYDNYYMIIGDSLIHIYNFRIYNFAYLFQDAKLNVRD